MSNYQTENLLTQTFRLAHFHIVFFPQRTAYCHFSILNIWPTDCLLYKLNICSHNPSNCLIYVLNIYSHKTFTSDCPICILNICSNRTPDRHIIIVNICSFRPSDCLISILNRSSQKRLVIFTKTLPSKSSLWWITYPHSRIRESLSSLLSMVSLGRSKSHL